jgi:hypothetical protein
MPKYYKVYLSPGQQNPPETTCIAVRDGGIIAIYKDTDNMLTKESSVLIGQTTKTDIVPATKYKMVEATKEDIKEYESQINPTVSGVVDDSLDK